MGKAAAVKKLSKAGLFFKGLICFFTDYGNGKVSMQTERPGDAAACRICRESNTEEHREIRQYIKDIDIKSAKATEDLRNDMVQRLDMMIKLLQLKTQTEN